MINQYGVNKLDYTQRYMIGHGTGTDATMDIQNEVTITLYEMDSMNRHFAHIYDRKEKRMTDGWQWAVEFRSGRDPEKADIWREW